MKAIKAAGLSDLPTIHNLAQVIWPSAYGDILSAEQLNYMLDKMNSVASLQNQLIESKHTFILVLNENIPVGFASFSPKEKNSSVFRLHKIYVLPRQQGNGTGKMILEYIINSIKEMGATSLELNVNRFNKARYFYEKKGFVITGEEDIDIGEGYFMNDFIMELSLK
jgi:GNAT superfamily N-acetyltransferase